MKKKITVISAAVCAAAFIIAVVFISQNMPKTPDEDIITTLAQTTEAPVTTSTPETEPVETKPPYVSPKDFPLLLKDYPHIHGWLNVSNSYIDYPIVQHPTDDTFYHRKTANGEDNVNGCIYTEHVYNRTDFNDPVTVLYGHYVGSKDNYEFFGGLQEMYSAENYENHKDITVYHQSKELHYEFYAAVRYDNEHIPWTYDFSDPESYNLFLERIKTFTASDTIFSPDVQVTPEDKLLIMSTCYNGGYGKYQNVRFIVIARLCEVME